MSSKQVKSQSLRAELRGLITISGVYSLSGKPTYSIYQTLCCCEMLPYGAEKVLLYNPPKGVEICLVLSQQESVLLFFHHVRLYVAFTLI